MRYESLDMDATSQSNMVLQQETFSFKRTLSYLGSLKRGLMEGREEKENAIWMHQKKQMHGLCAGVVSVREIMMMGEGAATTMLLHTTLSRSRGPSLTALGS